MTGRGPGRPSKISKRLIDQIAQTVAHGNYMETAAAVAGIHKDTLYEWLKRGAAALDEYEATGKMPKSEKLYAEFSDALTRAQAEAEAKDVQLIGMAALDDWRAAAWRLERRNPDRWGKKDRLDAEMELKGEAGIVLKVNYGDEEDDDE